MKLNIFADMTQATPLEERLRLIKAAGFDGVMLGFTEGDRFRQFELADRAGLEIENVHSPFDRMNALWEEREDSGEILERTLDCIRVCRDNGIKKVVVHPTDGLVPPAVTDFGLSNFSRILDLAVGRGVTVLFENIQLPQFLGVLFGKFGDCPNAGFCYDVGHESCFTPEADTLSTFGQRLGGLHIHDNDGRRDQHLIPFDGVIDYAPFLEKLRRLGHEGPLSLELYMTKSELYRGVSCADFIARGFEAAVRLREMYERTEVRP